MSNIIRYSDYINENNIGKTKLEPDTNRGLSIGVEGHGDFFYVYQNHGAQQVFFDKKQALELMDILKKFVE